MSPPDTTAPAWSLPEPQPPTRRWTWGWRGLVVVLGLCVAAGGVLSAIDSVLDETMPLWTWAGLAAGVALLAAGTVLVWRDAARPRWRRGSLDTVLPGREELRVVRAALVRGRPVEPGRRRAVAVLAARETGALGAYSFWLVIAGQQLVLAAGYDLTVWRAASFVVAPLMLVTFAVARVQAGRIRRTALAAGLLPTSVA